MLAGLAAVPCLPIEAEDTDSALLALTENLQRRDLHFLEEAAALSAYLRKTGETQEELAAKLGRSASALANKLRLLKLSPDCVREILAGGTLGAPRPGPAGRLRPGGPGRRGEAHPGAAAERCPGGALSRLPSGEVRPPGRRSYVIKDVRLFLNSVDRGLRVIREAGVDAQTERQETEDAIILTIRIPRGLPEKTVTGL